MQETMTRPGRPKFNEEPIDRLAALKRLELEDAQRDTRFGSSLGRLYRADKITGVEFMAGEGFVALVENYRRVKGLPNGRPKPNQLEPRIPGNAERDYAPDYVREIEDRYDEIYEAVIVAHGAGAMRVLNDVCLEDGFCEFFNQDKLKAALRTIAQKLRL